MTMWLSSDHHLGHRNILKHCNRPFSTIEEHDNVLIDNINKLVQPNDQFYILGDVVWMGAKQQQWIDYRNRINCRNLKLLLGNHDYKAYRQGWLTPLFSSINDLLEICHQGQFITLCHYCMRTWPRSHKQSYHAFGHSHQRLSVPNSLCIDVGVDGFDYKPISIHQFISIMKSKEEIIFKDLI